MNRVLLLACVLAFSTISHVSAQTGLLSGLGGTSDFGTECLSTNDDGSSDEIDITPWFPAGLQFFDTVHTSVFVNTNGNISFGDDLGTYTPNPFPVADRPMIAPYWADVDIRGESCDGFGGNRGCADPTDNGVWWHGEPGRMVITWHNVGYFSCNDELKMNFQLILTASEGGCAGTGDFDVEFRYNRCDWETGDASGGTDGFGGTEAQAGFDAGNTMDFVEIAGSREPGIAEQLCTGSNIGERGVWRFQIRRGTVTCPDAGDECDTGLQGACGAGLTACIGSGTECVSITESSDEICDAIDNDCDGMVDEGEAICGGIEVCDRGACLDVCFEGGCPEGQMCTEDGRCVDTGCEDIECPAGERCAGGECVNSCAGIVCPAGQSCNSGRCSDVCASIVCDESCQVCEDGACIGSCQFVPCAASDTCLADGRCFETACIGVSCVEGEVCEAGACVDACNDAVCPEGEMCTLGDCVPMMSMMPDGGPGTYDGGPGFDAGNDAGPQEPDAAMEVDAGRIAMRDPGGCGCRVDSQSGAPSGLWLLLGLVGLRFRRRR